MTEEQREPEDLASVDAPYWMHLKGIHIDGRSFDLEGRKYQHELMRPWTGKGKSRRFKHNEVIRKGAQIGITIGKVAEATHGAIKNKYPKGII